jgi:hypothetical protein
MVRIPLSTKDSMAMTRFSLKHSGFTEDAIEKLLGNWYPIRSTRNLLCDLDNRGWHAAEEDIIAFLEATFPERKHELTDNLDRLIWDESTVEYLANWLVTHQRGRLSRLGEAVLSLARAHGCESIDDLIATAAQMLAAQQSQNRGANHPTIAGK